MSFDLTTNHQDSNMDVNVDDLLINHFSGRIVRKDLTRQLKEGANVPVYVFEYLLGMYSNGHRLVNQ